MAQTIKNLPAMQKTQVLSQGQEDSLEKGSPLQYSCLRIPWTEEPGGLCPWGKNTVAEMKDAFGGFLEDETWLKRNL